MGEAIHILFDLVVIIILVIVIAWLVKFLFGRM